MTASRRWLGIPTPSWLIKSDTPQRVRNILQMLPGLASALKPGKPRPGHPPGPENRHPATRHEVGKTAKREPAQGWADAVAGSIVNRLTK